MNNHYFETKKSQQRKGRHKRKLTRNSKIKRKI